MNKPIAIAISFILILLESNASAIAPLQEDLSAWWIADAGVYSDASATVLAGNNDAIIHWKDQINNTLLSRYGVSPTYRKGIINGHSVVRFSGQPNEWMRNADFLPPTDKYTVFVVTYAWSSGPLMEVLPVDNYDDEVCFLGLRTDNPSSLPSIGHMTNSGVDTTYLGYQEGLDYVEPHIIVGEFGNTSDDLVMWIDGVASNEIKTGTGNQFASHSPISRSVVLGYYNHRFIGDVAEILIYSRKLCDAERNQVGIYLAEKYGLTTQYQPTISEPVYGAGAWWVADFGTYSDIYATVSAGNNDAVMQWKDRINNVLLTRYGIAPTYQTGLLNGHSVVRFSGATNEWMRNANFFPTTDEYTAFVVAHAWSSGPLLEMLPVDDYDDEVCFLGFRTDNPSSLPFTGHMTNGGIDTTYLGYQEGPDYTGTHIIAGEFGNASDDLTSWVDGVASSETKTGTGNQAASYSSMSRSVVLGYYNHRYVGDIAEVLIYPWKLSEAERNQTGTYLTQKYSIANSSYSSTIPPEEASIEDSRIRVTLRKTGNDITLTRLDDPVRMMSFLPANGSLLWRVRLRKASDGSLHSISNQCRSQNVQLSQTAGQITGSWSGVYLDDIQVFDVTVMISLDAMQVGRPLWQLSLTNVDAGYSIYEVDFPTLAARQLTPEGNNNYLVTGIDVGRLIADPFAMTSPLKGEYPGQQSLQLMALYDPDVTGLYLATEDGDGKYKTFYAEPSSDSSQTLTLRVTHYPTDMYDTGVSYTSPTLRMGSFDGTWWAASKIYRDWAMQQAWCENAKLAQRTDIPDWYKNSSIWNNPWVLEVGSTYGEHPAGADFTLSYDYFDDEPMIAHLYNWHKHWFDTGAGDYFPPRNINSVTYTDGDDCLTSIIAAYQSNNTKVVPYVNARFVSDCIAWYTQNGTSNATRDENGNIVYYDGTNLVSMCPYSQAWDDELIDICEQLAHYGIDGIYLDTLGTGPYRCHSIVHGHPGGGGGGYSQTSRDLVANIRTAVNATFINDGYPNKKVMLTGEGFSEILVGVLDSGLITQFNKDAIPLFNSIYHDYLMLWGNIINPQDTSYSALNEWFHVLYAYSFVRGDQLGWYRFPDIRSDYAANLSKKRSLSDVSKYLVTGEMVEPPTITSNLETLITPGWYGGDNRTFPKVLHSAWKAEDGTVGLVFANLDTSSFQFISYKFDAAKYGLSSPNIRVTGIALAGRIHLGTYSASSLLTNGFFDFIPAEEVHVLEFSNE